MISITYNGGAGSVTEEEAAGKRGSWGCSDQLLTNKMIQEQVIANRNNLFLLYLQSVFKNSRLTTNTDRPFTK